MKFKNKPTNNSSFDRLLTRIYRLVVLVAVFIAMEV